MTTPRVYYIDKGTKTPREGFNSSFKAESYDAVILLSDHKEVVAKLEDEIRTLKDGVTDKILQNHLLGIEVVKAENKQLFKTPKKDK